MKFPKARIPLLLMKLQGITVGKNLTLYGWPVIAKRGDGELTIGNGVRIISNSLANLIGLYQRSIILSYRGGIVRIGDRVGMSGVTVFSRKKLKLEQIL